MSTRDANVNLVIRARTEGEKAVAALADLVTALGADASQASGGVATLGKALADLDKSAAKLTAAQEKVEGAATRQAAAVHASAAGIAEQQDRVETLTRSLGILSAEADKAFVGPKRDGLSALVKSTKAQLADAQKQVDRYSAAYDRNLAQLRASRSSLLNLQRGTAEVADGQATAAAAIENTTQALNEQVAAGSRVTDMQRRINSITGVDRSDGSGSAAAAASVLVEADNIYRRAEARQAEIEKLREQEAAAAALADAEQRQQKFSASQGVTSDPRGAQARQSAEAFIAAAEAEAAMDREARALNDAVNPLAAIQERYNTSLVRYRELAAAGKLSADQLAAAELHLAEQATKARQALDDVGGRQKIGLFGLKPYELQNFGYQVNDVVTQLASGTSLSQTLAQQGGQILQLFPKVGGAIVGALSSPEILGFAAVMTGIVLALKEAADRAERLRDITATLNINAQGGDYKAANVADIAEDLEDMGAKAKDATAAVRELITDGVNPARLGQFAKAAQDAAVALGEDLPAAAKEVAAAFTSGYDAVVQLDDKLHFLTATEREHIRSLFDSGQAEAARTEALNAFSQVMDKAARSARGEWSDAWLGLKKVGGDAIKAIADTGPLKLLIYQVNEVAKAFALIGGNISDSAAKNATPSGAAKEIADTQARIKELEKNLADLRETAKKSPGISGTINHLLEQTSKQLASAKAQLAAIEKKSTDTTDDGPNSARAKTRADLLSQIDLEDQLQQLRDKGHRGLDTADSKRREALAGELAYRAAIKANGDQIVAQREKERAVAHEVAETDRENLAARTKAIKQFESQVIGAEGGSGKNKAGSAAAGFGQFLPGTYLSLYKQTYGSGGLSDKEILATRFQENIAKGIIDAFTRQNASFLDKIGAKVTAGNLYLTHMFGTTPLASALLNNGNIDTPVDQIINRYGGRNAGTILSQNSGYLRSSKGGPYRTAGQFRNFLASRVGADGDVGAPESEGQNAINTLLVDAEKRQRELNLAVKEGNDERTRTTDALQQEAGLYGTALLAEQRRQAIIAAEAALRKSVDDKNKDLPENDPRRVSLTQDQIDDTKRTTAEQFDQQHSRDTLGARLADVQRPVDDLAGQKDELEQQSEFLKSIGDNDGVERVQKQIAALTPDIQRAYDALIQFYQALTPTERVQLGILDQKQLDNIIGKLKQAKQSSQEWGRILGVSSEQIAQSFASSATSAITNFIQKVASGQNVFKALGDSVREFAANFIMSIAQMIIQIYTFAAAVAILRALGVPVPAAFGGASSGGTSTAAAVHHAGGLAGETSAPQRTISSAWFAGAMRYHTGGIAGLSPDEVPAILQRGEEVITASDARHRGNGGGRVGNDNTPMSVKVVNLSDPADALAHALSTKKGERVILNHVRNNNRAFKSAIENG